MNISKEGFIAMLERMASFGTAPEEGCSIFGVGYEDAFSRIKSKYFNEQFSRGTSSEKFVVGPFGSGKTHFLRQLMEIARDMECVTSEVVLNKDVDFTKSLVVYEEIVRGLRIPQTNKHESITEYGIKSLLSLSIDKIRYQIEDKDMQDVLLNGWISGLDKHSFKLDMFGKVVKKALIAKLNEDEIIFDSCCRWLEGDINDKSLSKELNVPKVDKSSNNLYAKRLMMSLFQFIRHAGFHGTVVCFDEAEQGLSVDKKKTEKILSMLMSGIEAITNLNGGSALLVYALTPDIADKMKNFQALHQRIISPPGRSFFDGNALAPLIDLRSDDPLADIQRIGIKLVEVFYSFFYDEISISKEQMLKFVDETASSIIETNISSSNRRDMVKSICSALLEVLETGEIQAAATKSYDNYYDNDYGKEV